MILWTIQNEQVLEDLIKNKVHRLYDFEKTGWGEESRCIKNAYDWLCKEMGKKLDEPLQNKQYPIWAWSSYNEKEKNQT